MIDVQEFIDDRSGEKTLAVPLRGALLLNFALLNKSSAFTEQERREFGLEGLLPAHVSTLEEQVARRYQEYLQKTTDLDRFVFLRDLQDRNETLYFRLLRDHLVEMLPVVYTPEVGEICQRYSHIFHRPRGVYISYPQRQDMDAILASRPYRRVDAMVVTDGERILGLGDQGVGGMAIPVGKLALYTLCGGIDPARTLPVVLDAGTNNPERLADPHYLGWQHERVRGPEYDAFVETFIRAVERHLPGVLLQWEDFALGNARSLLDRYRDRLCSFNDDVQGTAGVALGALLAAGRATGCRLRDQRVVFVGAGSAGTGIADLILTALAAEGLTADEARSQLWLVDRHGLLHSGMGNLTPAQQRYCQPQDRLAGWSRGPGGDVPLIEVVRQVRPTALIGVSGQPGLFSEEVVRAMAQHVERPLILALSNPTSRSEARPADVIAWTAGRALLATGSPFPAVTFQGRTIPIAQCNNCYVFPGLGLGVLASGTRCITDELFVAAARVLGDWPHAGTVYDTCLLPPMKAIVEVARRVALAVGLEAQGLGLARSTTLSEWERALDDRCWEPRYRPMRYRPLNPESD